MSTSIGTFVETVYVAERSLKPESLRQLRMSIRLFIEFAGDVDLDDMNHEQLNAWIARNPRNWSPATMKRRVADVLAVWNYAYSIAATERCPNTKRIRRVQKIRPMPEAWTLDELRRIVSAAERLDNYLPNGVRVCDLIAAVVYVGFYSALRPQDLMVLRRDQLSTRGVFIPQQKKHGLGVLVTMPEWVIQFINSKYPETVTKVFAWPYRREYFYSVWHQCVNAAGLPSGTRHALQKLRRTAVSYGELARSGYGAQLAGHVAGSRVTVQHYVDPRIVLQEQPNLLPDLRGPSC